jgi:glucokinase
MIWRGPPQSRPNLPVACILKDVPDNRVREGHQVRNRVAYRVLVKKKFIPVGRPAHLRHTNALTILKLLREVGSCSRADLVRASGLSAPTVTNVVGDLLASNLVKPLGEGESSGGRPPDMISFKAERGCLLAVQITAHFIAFLLTDLSGAELEISKVSLEGQKSTPEAICHSIGVEVRRLLRKQKMAREQLLVLVVGVPAITNVDDGIVVSISTLQNWRSVPLRALLNKVVDCLVIIENDTNLSALGERHRGAAQFEETFILINIGDNVSAGIVLGGRIHHGAQWSAGEIAYLRLPHISRKLPTLHEFGELESVLTSSAILRSWQEGATDSDSAAARVETDATAILDLANAGDLHAKKIVQYRAAIVSDILVNLSLILNPGLLLLGGEVGSHPLLIDLVHKHLERSEFAVTRIAAATLGDRAVLWGAIAAALEEIPFVLLPQPGR